ncbi:hypothetical protein EYC59_06050 [Candidatus Saccharibacteria bacterium]|nr:MAG: hypothetical protein EYC59_06050 [Candidatus Saccharibacteria bacterium]
MTRKEFLAFSAFAVASVFGVVGILKLFVSHAATQTVDIEPEDGTFSGGVTKVTDANASGGNAVKFGASGSFVAFAPGTVKPLGYADEAAGLGTRNVGPRITNLTRYDGDYTLTPGAKVSGLEIFGRLVGRGDANTVVSDCIVHGSTTPAMSNSAGVLGTSYNLGGVAIEWCRININANAGFTDSIAGGNYTLRYSEVAGGVDGIGANTIGDATIECCRIWNGYYFAWWNASTNSVRTATFTDADGDVHPVPFPAQSSGDTHSDGMQIQQYGNWTLRGCYVGGNRGATARAHLDPTVAADCATMKQLDSGREFVNACLLISSATAANPVSALVEKNWFEGGAARVNITWKNYDDLSGVTIQDNRFIRSNYGYYIYKHVNNASVFSNNVFDDTDTPVMVSTFTV